ncbi:hypothetical protein [Arthrobacter sp. ISL-28]|uniref:hypothetical protein n=1 Tax=Arthrobacter sp. ISL-28 TaxID=2819108 RepID=UPI001BE886F5|nr:hypothetical protein [Arthrobacter sp. ISL-28]MBT2521157.1 hypothetical protein [Arthrobacter sp. ISL-28]
MLDPSLVLTGGFLVLAAIALWMVLNRRDRAVGWPQRDGSYPRTSLKTAAPGLRWQLAGCAALAAVGLDVAVVYGIGAPSPARSGITAELGFAMMLLAVVWFLFRQEVVRFQLRTATAVFDLPEPADPGQVRAAESVGAFIRLLLFLLGLFTVLVKLVLG